MKYTVNIKAADFKDGLFGTGFFLEKILVLKSDNLICNQYEDVYI